MVSNVEPEAFEQEIRTYPLVQDVKRLTQADERYLFEIDWDPAVDSLVQPMIQNGADLLRGKGGPEEWEFRVQFSSRDQLVAFRDACLEDDIHLDLRRMYNAQVPTETQRLSDAQIDALLRSYEEGYWNVPRETDLGTLGEMLGISDTAVSQRLRRGVNTLIEEYVVPNVER